MMCLHSARVRHLSRFQRYQVIKKEWMKKKCRQTKWTCGIFPSDSWLHFTQCTFIVSCCFTTWIFPFNFFPLETNVFLYRNFLGCTICLSFSFHAHFGFRMYAKSVHVFMFSLRAEIHLPKFAYMKSICDTNIIHWRSFFSSVFFVFFSVPQTFNRLCSRCSRNC